VVAESGLIFFFWKLIALFFNSEWLLPGGVISGFNSGDTTDSERFQEIEHPQCAVTEILRRVLFFTENKI
jgi:hypothetical protein